MDQQKAKLWTKDFIFVSAINFLITLVFYLLMVTIAVFAVNEYHTSTSQSGLITGIFIIGSLIGRLLIGRFIDNIGRKKTLVLGVAFFVLTTLLYFVEIGVTFLLFNRFIHGFFMGMAGTASGTIVAQIIPAKRKAEGIGYFSMSATLATAIGPFIGLYMSQHTTFQMIFIFCVALGIISFLVSLFVYVPALEATGKGEEIKGFKISNFIEPKAVPIAIVTLLVAFCYSSVLSYINSYAIELDLVSTASFFFLIYAVAVLVSRPFTGRWMDSKGANFIMYPAFIIFAAGMLLLSLVDNSFMLLLSGVLIGFGFGNMQSSTQAIAVKLTPAHRMGLATSTFFIALDAGLGFGPYVLGYIIDSLGYQKLYIVLTIMILVVFVLYYFLHGKKEKILMANKLKESKLA